MCNEITPDHVSQFEWRRLVNEEALRNRFLPGEHVGKDFKLSCQQCGFWKKNLLAQFIAAYITGSGLPGWEGWYIEHFTYIYTDLLWLACLGGNEVSLVDMGKTIYTKPQQNTTKGEP